MLNALNVSEDAMWFGSIGSQTTCREACRPTAAPERVSRPRRCRGLHRDRGQAAVLVVLVCLVIGLASTLAVAGFGRGAADRTRAQTAADAAALASVQGGRAAAAELAASHGGDVVGWYRGPGRDEVTVTVRVGRATATARATNST